MSYPAAAARSPLSVVFLMHIGLEIPLALQGLWAPTGLPFLEMNNTTLVMLKMFSALLLSTCLGALLVFPLPEFLPGKRAFAIALCLYHTIVSTTLFQAPRFIPLSLGALAESYKVTPEVIWGTLHGIIGLFFITWWQATVGYAAAMRKA